MSLLALRVRSAASLLALTLLCGASRSHAGTEADASELNFNIATQNSTITLVSGSGGPNEVFTIAPGLFGSVDGLHLKTNANSGITHIKATVTLHNSSNTALHHVTATVYVSDDNTLSADDTKVTTLNLSDYVSKGRIGKFKTLSLPLKQKVPTVMASYLEGKYLIVVLSADELGTAGTNPIVVGPITLP